MPWDTIESAKYDRLNLSEPYLPELRRRSTARREQEPEFKYIREDVSLFKKAQADKTISLNEKQRLKEKEEADARQKTRDKERLARAEPLEKVYELTMSQVEQPGLPAPVTKTNALLAKANQPQASLASTNSASASVAARTGDATTDEESDEPKANVPDASLQEAEHILVDYLSLLPKKQNLVSAGHTAAVQRD